MKICTITCHDVYNHGASLQAYALMKYLSNCGHDVEIIDYKPDYLSNHYKLLNINNPKWESNIITKSIYLILKVPGRILELKRKKAFDRFTARFLNKTKTRYKSNKELKGKLPDAEVFLCGSDQIWNTLHQNGRDPAFYLDFVPKEKIKASYASSFATDIIEDKYKAMVQKRVKRLDAVGVREKSGVKILRSLDVNNAVNVVDPVFLFNQEDWDLIGEREFKEKYILVYDFDDNALIKEIALNISREKGYKIYSVNPGRLKYANRYFIYDGPETFVSLIRNAQFVIANSFHAAVFSIIYEKDFVIVNRNESINTRMRDLLDDLGLCNRLVDKNYNMGQLLSKIDYSEPNEVLNEKIKLSKNYLFEVLNLSNRRGVS
jgi:exopolysaccharide biosynthesis predicted pyruvyltransferase EpsI